MTARLLVWARPGQESIIREALAAADVELAAIGADSTDDAQTLSKTLKVPRVADLRQAFHEQLCEILWIASDTPLAPDERRLIRASKLQAISSEPRPGALADLVDVPDDADAFRFVPLMRRSEGFRAARQALENLAAPHVVSIAMRGPSEAGSLLARLYDAFDLIDGMCGDIELIAASLATPTSTPGEAGKEAPESLHKLHGHMTVNVRFAENRCAAIVLSSVSDTWFRGVTLLSTDGCLRITDTDCEFPGDTRRRKRRTADPPTPGGLIGTQLRRMLDDLDHDDPPPDHTQLLALCEAARLSCRTGQAESPARLRAMMSHV